MELSGEEINMLASLITSFLTQDMSKQEIVTLRLLVGQIHCCLNTIIVVDNPKNKS